MERPQAGFATRFTIESHLLSTRSADASKAIDRERGLGVCLWTLRHPLSHNSESIKRFMSRLASIRDLVPPVSIIDTFGVDPSGIAFAVMPALDGAVVDSGNLEPAEAERRLISCIKLTARLHEAGIVCGDLCSSSFVVGRSGEVRFIGVLGSFDAEAAATAMLPPTETLHFVAPEQRAGGGLEPASDVFALGVLGYHLLTGAYPYPSNSAMFTGDFDPSQIKPVSAFTNHAPMWAEEVLLRCLAATPTSRYANAGEMLSAISLIRQQFEAGQRSPAETSRGEASVGTGVSRATKGGAARLTPKRPEREENAPSKRVRKSSARRAIIALLGMLLTASATALILAKKAPRTDTPVKNADLDPLIALTQNTNLDDSVPRLKQADTNSANPDQQQMKTELERLANSNDPVAHALLVKLAKRATVREARDLAEAALLDRARRLGLQRSSEQVRQWLRTIKDNALPAAYEAVLGSLDSTLPLEARGKNLTQTYAALPKLAMKLAASLALDSQNPEDYRIILTQLLLDQTHNQ
ncbi:MAG: hypothetical protein EBZ48_07585, partial [Proteobacteria bacterium]|nr:hypothetical protein [Pseudomonadota bacterium]